MADYRTKRQKLEAMANQTESPHEAEVARKKLAAMGVKPERPRGTIRNDPPDDGGWTAFYEDLIKQASEQAARAFRRSNFYYGWDPSKASKARPSGWEGQGARPEYIYQDDVLTAEDLIRARDSMGGPRVMSKEEADRQAEAMYQEIRRRQETERMDRDAWRKAYRTPWGYEDKESDDEDPT